MEVLRYGATTSQLNFHSESASPTTPRKDNARRRLNFGPQPVAATCAQEANDEFLQSLMSQMAQSYRQKWEFDFEAGQPLPSSSNSRFHYKPMDIDVIPSVYSPLVHSTSLSDEENLSDAENCCVLAPMNLNRLADLSNNLLETSAESMDDSTEFVLPCQSPKKLLKKQASSAYSTPKKRRDMQVTDYIPYRSKRSSLVGVSKKESPFKPPRNTVRSSPYNRHSIVN